MWSTMIHAQHWYFKLVFVCGFQILDESKMLVILRRLERVILILKVLLPLYQYVLLQFILLPTVVAFCATTSVTICVTTGVAISCCYQCGNLCYYLASGRASRQL